MIIWLILIYFRMSSIQLYRLQKCSHFIIFFCIHCIVYFILEEVIVLLLGYFFMFFCKRMEVFFAFLQIWFWHDKWCWHLFRNFWSLYFTHGLSHLIFVRVRYTNYLISSWNLALTYLVRVFGHLVLQLRIRLR